MGSTKISAPSTPAAPTTAQNMQDYVANLPAMYKAQMEWSPKFNQQDYEQTAIYAPLMKQLQDTLYPNTSALPEQLAGLASSKMGEGMPQYMKDTYQDQFRAEIGNQAGSGIGADYVSRNMLNQNEQYKQYYNNLALSVAGMQPLSQSSAYQQAYTPASTYSYGQVANNNMQGYGSYVGAFSNMQSAAMNANATLGAARMDMMGKLGGGALQGFGASGGFQAMFASSASLKDNIKNIDLDALSVIESLNPVEFTYKNDDHKVYGFIAEESPDIITNKEKNAVDAYSCIGVLTRAVQQLSKKVSAMEGSNA